MLELFTLFIYQPFFNVLVGLYWFLSLVTDGRPDMGVAVILLTLFIRFLLLPLSLAGQRSEEDRRAIAQEIKELEEKHSDDPVTFKKLRKKVFRQSRGVVAGELLSLVIQVTIALMLWRIFGRGLVGEDLHLIYNFMPNVETPFNLVFLGKYDLSHTSLTLNALQSFLIFVFETLNIMGSPYPPSKGEVVRLQLTLPLVSFLIFMGLPAGKKLFIITTLCFSIVLAFVRYIKHRFYLYKNKIESKEEKVKASDPSQQPILVDI